ncbi:hypothetical protein ODE01S_19950 [Oceanithermus desulfurans NBRC 100063]|uniref:ATPase n=1 Tax=Oceanithermus desulfurans NBRC 100063 TaxID=1227550 RepID=A0A511RLM6_9DEIN|nr:hypothetical protein ODE01S_19950 [Oceanithermus desulfurans NBRC 100063]
MPHYRPRHLSDRLKRALKTHPAVFLEGARQVGKTTLVKKLARELEMRYVTLDDLDLLTSAQADPEGFLTSWDEPLVIDEVQRAPELLLAIKARVDRKRAPGRYLLTGSANVLALPRVAEALVGRMAVLTLYPFSQGELEGRREAFLERAFQGRPHPEWEGADVWERVRRGGFPEAVRLENADRAEWFAGYVRTLLERDVRDISGVEQVAVLHALLALLAERTGSLLNISELSRSLGRPRSTTDKYLRLFEKLFLVHRLPAWAANPTKRLTRSPKLHMVDTGLAVHLARVFNEGALLETFVTMELTKQLSWTTEPYRLAHFRDASGREVDLVLEGPEGLVGIEVKSKRRVGPGDFSGLRVLKRSAPERFRAGFVLHPGPQALPFGDHLWSLPIQAVWRWGNDDPKNGSELE